jgi:hypothetical protein
MGRTAAAMVGGSVAVFTSIGANAQERQGLEKLIPEGPMPIEPPAMHPRVAAQEGRFIIFGRVQDLLDHKIYRERENGRELEKAGIMQIPFSVGENVDALFEELANLGVSRRTLFPDLDGLAEFVRWIHFSRSRRP